MNRFLLFALSGSVIAMLSCQPAVQENSTENKVSEYINISVLKDTSDYLTQIILQNNPEVSDMLIVQYRLKITNVTVNPENIDTITISEMEIVENPYGDSAPFSINYDGCPNGLYDENNKRIEYPFHLILFKPLHCILKHGHTLDSTTVAYLKNRFPDLNNVRAKEVFEALLEKGLNLQNDKTLQGEEFQLKFYTKRGNLIERDLLFPYNNYCR